MRNRKKKNMTLLVCDLGGTTVKFGLYDKGRLFNKSSFRTPTTWEEMKSTILNLKDHFSYRGLKGVALSCPGAVDTKKGIIYGRSAIPYIHRFPIQDELSTLLELPVTIENDANCAALAELNLGVARNASSSVFFIIGTGVGGAIAQGRQLLRGEGQFGGEFGCMILKDGLSMSKLVSPVRRARLFAQQYGYPDSFSGKELFTLAEVGDKRALEVITEMYDYLAIGIYNVLVATNPELVVIGGGISARADLIEQIQQRLDALLVKTKMDDLTYRIEACEFRNDANLLGAASHFVERYGM